jgi:hypothetical protein
LALEAFPISNHARQLMPDVSKAPLLQWRDFVVAENNFIGNASPEIKSTATKEEGEQICVSQNKVRSNSLPILSSLSLWSEAED